MTDKLYLSQHYTVHHNRGARALNWSSDARPSYVAVFLLVGKLRWQRRASEANESGDIIAPHVLLVNPGEALSLRSSARATHLTLNLMPSFVLDCAVRARLTHHDADITFRHHAIALDARLERLSSDLTDELLNAEAGQEIVIHALLEQLTIYLLRRYANARRDDALELSRVGMIDRRLRRAVELMHANLERDLPLEEIAAAAYLSPFHFARLFKKTTGLAPHAYLAALRTRRAEVLLATTDLSVTEISGQVGYSSSSHFTKAFRQATGFTPRLFRQALERK